MANNSFSIIEVLLDNNKISKSPNIPEIIYFKSGSGTIFINQNPICFKPQSFVAISPKSTYLIESEKADLFILPIDSESDGYIFNQLFFDKESALLEALEIAYLNYYSGTNDVFYQQISNECCNIIHLILLEFFNPDD